MSVQSMTSLGRVGRILAGSIDPSAMSIDREYFANSSANTQQQMQHQLQQQQRVQQTQLIHSGSSSTLSSVKSVSVPSSLTDTNSSRTITPAASGVGMGVGGAPFESTMTLQEPDVIASTKLAHSKTTDSITSSGPIAPPRRKKKSKKGSTSSSDQFYMNDGMRLPPADTDTDSDTRSVKSVRDVQQKLRDDLVKEIEKSWNETNSLPNSVSDSSCSGSIVASSNADTVCGSTGVGGAGITTSATLPMTLGGFSSISALGSNVSSACSSGNVSSNTVVSVSGTSLSQISTCNARPVSTAAIGGSINRISHSLNNSSISVYSKPSPSNSAKSNSAPGRVR